MTEQTQALAITSRPIDPAEDNRSINVFASTEAFVTGQRMAKALASSTLLPKEYQGNIPNVMIAMELAARIGASVFAVMQNIDVIHGRPSWRATFLIATVNSCGRFSPLRYRFQGDEGKPSWGCRAYAKDRETGEECVGTLITIAMAKAEGWSAKNGSKWTTMPEQMLMYRAAAFWCRVYAPELSLGMHTSEEMRDAGERSARQPTNQAGALRESSAAALLNPAHDPVTGDPDGAEDLGEDDPPDPYDPP